MATDKLPDDITEEDVLNAIINGCRTGHTPSERAARNMLMELSKAEPVLMADILDALRFIPNSEANPSDTQ